MKVFRPRTRAWLVLLIVASPMLVAGIVVFIEDASDWLVSLLTIGVGLWLLGFNATLRLVMTSDEVLLKRFGMTVWCAPLKGTRLVNGRGGQPPIIPAYVLRRGSTDVGYILKTWFSDETVAELRTSLEAGPKPSPASHRR
jgi:hypothetical protein